MNSLIIKNIETGMPIPFVHVLSQSGASKTTSDAKGEIKINNEREIRAKDTVYISHISFKEKTITIQDLLSQKVIYLEPKIYQLPDVVISSEPKETKYTHYVLTSLFSSWQHEDQQLEYYMDGVIEYYIPFDKESEIEVVVRQFRSFKNEALIKSKLRMTTFSTFPGFPHINRSRMTERLDKNHFIISAKESEPNVSDISFREPNGNEILIGQTETNPAGIEIRSDANFIWGEPKIDKIFGYSYRTNSHIVMEEYSPKLFLDSLPYFTKFKSYKNESLKHKKEKDFRTIEQHQEIHVLNINLVSEEEFLAKKQAISRSKKFNSDPKKRSRYDRPYWEEEDYFKQFYASIKSQLNDNMVEQKKLKK